MLICEAVSLQLHKKELLKDICFSAKKGKITGVLGANGAGKSSLLNVLCGEFNKYQGSLSIDGEDLSTIDLSVLAKKRALISQHEQISINLNVLDYVLLGRLAYTNGRFSSQDYDIAQTVLAYFDVSQFMEKPFLQLSGGERQRVQLAKALAQLCSQDGVYRGYLFLDEYSAHMDIYYQQETLIKLQEFVRQKALAVVVIGHDLNLALTYYDNCLLLKKGEMLGFGETGEILTQQSVYDAFSVSCQKIKLSKHKDEKSIFVF